MDRGCESKAARIINQRATFERGTLTQRETTPFPISVQQAPANQIQQSN